MKRNRFKCDHGWDIDLDDGSSNYIIEENLMLSGGLKLREGFDRVVRNNILLNSSFHPHVWFENSGDVFEQNIVMAPYQPIGIKAWGKSVDRNLFTSAADLQQARARGTDPNSLAGDPQFVDPAQGNFAVRPTSPALTLGFANFPTDRFGVRPARLRALASRPVISEPDVQANQGMQEQPRTILGLTVKSIETLGEQSAAGLLSKEGVLILAVTPASNGDKAGLQTRDVIVGLGKDLEHPEQLFSTAAAFVSAVQAKHFQHHADLIVVRDQRKKAVQLQLH
jgi:hypothetical protein